MMKKKMLRSFKVACLVLLGELWGSLLGCSSPLEKLWEFPVTSPIYSTPLVIGDLIVFGSESGTLHAVNTKGQARWQYQVPISEIFAHPQTNGELVFFGATNQTFYAVNLMGKLVWKFTTRERIKSDPAVVDDVIFVTSYDGHIYALKAQTGEKLWQFPKDEIIVASETTTTKGKTEDPVEVALDPKPQAFSYAAPVVKDGVLYVGNLDGYLYAVYTADGKIKWRFKTDAGITSTAWVEDGTVYFGSKDNHVYAIDAETGQKVLWKFKTGDDVLSSPKIYEGTLYIGSNDSAFYALDPKTGKEKCHFKAKGPIVSYGAFFQDWVFFGGEQNDNSIYAIQKDKCELVYSYTTGYQIKSDPVVEGDIVYFTSGDRKLYAFKINLKR
jgi:outer membrane protein assembly factor BamB